MSPLLPISSLKESIISPSKGGQAQRQRLRLVALALIACPLYLLLSSHSGRLPFGSSVNERSLVASLCPSPSVTNYVPTIILRATGDVDRNANRTYWVDPSGNSTILPGAHPRQELRFSRKRPSTLDETPASSSSFYSSTPEPPVDCSFQVVPSSPPTPSPKGWKDNSIMFGMSTRAERILYNIPVWDHWLPTHRREFNSAPVPTTDLPLVFALIPPPTAKDATRLSEGLDDLQEMGLNVKVTATVAPRFERRYLQLVQEMWAESVRREEKEGVVTEWFVFADDDTFFLEWNGLTRMLSAHNSSEEILIGGLSEVALQVEIFGRMAFGGAGIFVSRALMQKMNAPGVYDSCVHRFGSTFGGDAMASYCAAASTISLNATNEEVLERLDTLLVIDPTLHQVDIRGDGTGFLQAGLLFTSFHHWASWVDVWPSWHSNSAGDIRSTIMLMGEAATRIGGDNFGRRYVFEQGEIVVTLGYSVSVYREALNATQLAQVEHTWEQLETFLPMRRPLVESIEKRNYYLTGTRKLSSDVYRLEHTDQTGERIDIVWDARAATSKASTWPQWRKGKDSPRVSPRALTSSES